MSAIDDANAAVEAANTARDAAIQVVADLEAEPTTGGGVVEYDSQVITNADGSVVVTLTPTAPAAVSDAAPADTGSPAGVVTDTGPTPGTEGTVSGPGPTGQ